MDSIHLESFHMHIDFQYAEAVRNIGQKYLELINTQDKDWIIEEYRDSKFNFVSKYLEVHSITFLSYFLEIRTYFSCKISDKPSYRM